MVDILKSKYTWGIRHKLKLIYRDERGNSFMHFVLSTFILKTQLCPMITQRSVIYALEPHLQAIKLSSPAAHSAVVRVYS